MFVLLRQLKEDGSGSEFGIAGVPRDRQQPVAPFKNWHRWTHIGKVCVIRYNLYGCS